jgi:uncharacterized membrane protein
MFAVPQHHYLLRPLMRPMADDAQGGRIGKNETILEQLVGGALGREDVPW